MTNTKIEDKTPTGVDRARFKSSMGVYLTKQLFQENDISDDSSLAVYTLKGYDHELHGKRYPSLRKLFVESEDPTEYSFACNHLFDYEHWKRICECSWFAPHLAAWREELELRVRSKALLRISQKAVKQDKDALQADKILLQGGWRTPGEKTSVGRPTKARIKAEANRLFEEKTMYDDDLERVLGVRQ